MKKRVKRFVADQGGNSVFNALAKQLSKKAETEQVRDDFIKGA